MAGKTLSTRRRAHEQRVADLEQALRVEDERLERITAAETLEELELAARRTIEEEGVPAVRSRAWVLVTAVAGPIAALVIGLVLVLSSSQQRPVPTAAPPRPPAPVAASRPPASRPTHGVELPRTYEPSVFLIRSTGGAARRLDVPPAHSWQPAWRPDGRALAVVSDPGIVELSVSQEGPVRGQPVWRNRRELVTMSLPALLPAYTPDGTRLAFTLSGEIWAVGLGRQSVVRRLALDAGYVDWSRDGRRMAFVRRGRVFVATADGRVLADISHGKADIAPKWAPNGRRIGFTRLDDGVLRVFISDPYGDVVRRMNGADAGAAYATWSPDGRKLAYCKFVDRNWELVVRDLRSGREQRLTRTATDESYPAWSPDGAWIAFTRDLHPQVPQ
jgi:TolB protein